MQERVENRAGTRRRDAYHHGNLRAELIDTALELIRERGVAQFSVAEAARRIGVSPGAPSRHFASRDELLVAVAVRVAERLADCFRAAIAASDDPAEQLAATAEAYVRFAADEGPGFDLIFTSGVDSAQHPSLREAGRAFMGVLWPLGKRLGADYESAVDLLEAHIACCQGYAAMFRSGWFKARSNDVDDIARRARAAARALIDGFSGPPA